MNALRTRDTDADWRRIGETEPYWGVLTSPQFRHDAMDAAALAAFYESGRAHVAALAEDFQRFLGLTLQLDKALDFGCGVGRLAEAMTAHARAVTGYDVSRGMLDVARSRGAAVRYVDVLPDESFDWINSYIVFQHISPNRGLDELDALLKRLAPGGLLSLHFTIWRDATLGPPPPSSLMARLRGMEPPVGEILMYDYDLSAVLQRLNLAGVHQTALNCTNHGGYHGVMIFARRADPPTPPRY